jgi:HAD superfamily hydrolase (TIGR01450 family)
LSFPPRTLSAMSALGWVLDLDGVVRLGTRRIAGAPEAVARLRAAGIRVVFATNNSNETIAEVEGQLRVMGVPADGAVVTSATAAATLVEPGERVLACGGRGVSEAITDRGATAVDGRDAAASVDAVMVGFHREFDYERLTVAVRAVLAGSRLIATNDDRTYPTPEGLAPGAGAIVGAIVAATEVAPEIAGKPNAPMAEAVIETLAGPDGAGPVASVVVGDRLDTDGALASILQADFALVLSGVAARADAAVEPAPTVVADDLAAVVDQLVHTPPVTARL